MKHLLKVLTGILLILGSILWPLKAEAQESSSYGKLTFERTVTEADLGSVACVTVSNDGKQLYSASFGTGIVNIFDRDLNTGQITLKSSISDKQNLAGAISVRLSDNGKFAAVTSIYAGTLTLYRRDPASGGLTQLALAHNNEAGVTGLTWPVDAAFSPDSRFIYTIDGDRGPQAKGLITVFNITQDNRLQWVGSNTGSEKCFDGVRGIIMHPDGKALYAVSSLANTLVVLSRNKKTGETTIKQIISDENGVVHGLEGAFGVTISPDKRYLYTTSGRFSGDNSVSVFKIKSNHKLELVQELFSGEKGLGAFSGGNEIVVSPDGRNVYASGSTSNSIVNLSRDTETGKLTYIETIEKGTKGPAGIVLSPDGNFLYVAAETARAITIFRRVTK